MAYRSCDYACKFIANKKHHCDYFSHQLCQDSGKLYQRYSFLTYHWGQAPLIGPTYHPGLAPAIDF